MKRFVDIREDTDKRSFVVIVKIEYKDETFVSERMVYPYCDIQYMMNYVREFLQPQRGVSAKREPINWDGFIASIGTEKTIKDAHKRDEK